MEVIPASPGSLKTLQLTELLGYVFKTKGTQGVRVGTAQNFHLFPFAGSLAVHSPARRGFSRLGICLFISVFKFLCVENPPPKVKPQIVPPKRFKGI